ncbi:MAG: hypothetical protein P8M71_07235 [Pseudomonadales bacterium]|nr:hypothetical protein [Pseudomonadales bacterium]
MAFVFGLKRLEVMKMSGQVATISTNSAEVGANDQANDIGLDIDDFVVESVETSMDKDDGKSVKFAKSTDIRRRLEERLEVRLLQDQLGIDDLGL